MKTNYSVNMTLNTYIKIILYTTTIEISHTLVLFIIQLGHGFAAILWRAQKIVTSSQFETC